MHIEPVMPDFEYVKIRRSGGIMGADQSLSIDRDLVAHVRDRRAGERSFNLDAFSAQELMQALAMLAERNPAPSTRKGCDMFHYDVELSVGGVVHRFHSVDIGADEALHGVMFAANRLIERDPDPVHIMSLHTQAPESASTPS